jgi:ribose transport system substrate-binding protein
MRRRSRRLFLYRDQQPGGWAAGRSADCGEAWRAGQRGVFLDAGQPNLDERLLGFKDVFESHPQVRISDVVDIKGDARNAFDSTQQYLTQTGDKKISAFICLEASSGKVVADAVRRQKATDRVVLAWDVEQDTLAEISDGTIEATIAQKPYTMGFVGLKELDEIFHNKPKSLTKDYSVDAFSEYPVFIDTGTALVDKANVDVYAQVCCGRPLLQLCRFYIGSGGLGELAE